MKKILVFGAGFIASHLKYEIYPHRLSSNVNDIREILFQYKPNVVINCIGKTGSPNIDWCEDNKEETLASNLIIPTILAAECNKLGIQFIHIGSGCIFYGRSPHATSQLMPDPNGTFIGYYNDKRQPLAPKWIESGWRESDNPKLENASFYSKVKYAADLAVGNLPNSSILRIRMPISSKNSPRNLINKLINYKNVLEEKNSVTFISDLVHVIEWVIENHKTGIYHVTNPLPMTHVDLLEEYRKYVPEHSYSRINKEELSQFVKAPRSNCILNTNKLSNEGFTMTPTHIALEKCIEEYMENK